MLEFFRKSWIAEAAAWALFAGAVGPVLVLAFYNHPSPADDFCFAFMTRDHGFWHGIRAYYTGWTGRYFACFLFHATPLWAGWLGYFKVMPWLLVAGLWHGLFSLLGEVFPEALARRRAALAAVLVAVFVGGLASLSEAFFWAAAVYVYVFPTVLLLYLLTWASRLGQERYRRIRPLGLLFAAFLTFAVVGCNEMLLILTLYLLGGAWVYGLVFRREFNGYLLVLLAVAGVSAYFVLSSPGNTVRLAGNTLGGDAPAALWASVGAAVAAMMR